jgi:hypothetical protein
MAMTEVYRNVTDAPPVAPPRYSLIGAVETVDDAGLRWHGGYSYVSELGPHHAAEPVDGCLDWNQSWLADWESHTVNVDPVMLWAGDDCHTTLGSRTRDWQGRARRRLNAYQSYDLARWLWTSVLTPLVTAAAGGGTSDVTAPAALGKLEDSLATSLQGVTGTILMQPSALTACVGAGVVRLDGARYVSPMGHVVAADAGFAGSAPDATAEDFWMIGVGPMRIRLSPIEVSEPDALGALNPLTNTVRVFAWRAAAVDLEPLLWDLLTEANGAPRAVGYAIVGGEVA